MNRRRLLGAAILGSIVSTVPKVALASPSTLTRLPSPQEEIEFLAYAKIYFQERADRVTNSGRLQTGDQSIPLTQSATAHLGDDVAQLRERVQQFGQTFGGYTSAQVRVGFVSGAIDGNIANIRVTERTKLYFARRPPSVSEATEYILNHDLGFIRTGSTWSLAKSQWLSKNYAVLPETQLPTSVPTYRAAVDVGRFSPTVIDSTKNATSTPRSMAPQYGGDRGMPRYAYGSMVNYAVSYGITSNPLYPPWEDDCTNFVSQVMYAGQWPAIGNPIHYRRSDNTKWWYQGAALSSYSWGGAQNWHEFALGSGRVSMVSDPFDLTYGDVMGYDFNSNGGIDHLAMVTGGDADTGDIYMTQHSDNYVDRPFSYIVTHLANGYTLYPHHSP